MLAWIGEKLFSEVVRKHLGNIVEEQTKKLVGAANWRLNTYQFVDALLAEGQAKSKNEIDAWFRQKRSELKTWAGV